MPDFSLINNLDVHLADAFTAALQDARNLDVAVAYFSYSGYQHILDSVEALLKRGGVVRFLLGVHPTPGAKALLLLLRQAQRDFGADHVAVRFIPPSDERDFHAKVYLIDRSPAATLIIGSSNLSQQGFVNNLELNYREIIPVDSEKFQQVSAWFQRLFTEEAKEFSWQTIEELFTIPPLAPTPTIPQPLSSTASYTDHFIALQLHYLRIPLGGRITPFFYQIEDVKNLVDEVENRIAGRRGKLIAHEVGLGKTVVAGLTIKELLQRRKIERILIVTPASVMEQWQEELWEKIGEDFAIITADTLAEQGNSAWHTAQQAICSVDFLKDQMLQTNPERQQRRHTPYILQESWPADLQFDFIVFDESHYAKSNAAMRYKALWQLVRQLRKPDGFILLLSATPVMNKEEELYYQLALTYPDMLRDADGKQQLPTRSDLGHLQDAWQQLRHSAIRRKLRKEEDIRPLFAERAAPTDRAFTLSSAETELYREFAMWITEQSEYYSILSAQADTQNSPYKRIAPFIKIAYLRQFCSSSEAIYRSLVGEDERTDDQWTLESEWNSQRSLFGDIGGSSTLSMRMGLKGRLLLAIRNGAIPFGNAGQRDIEELRELFGALEESSDGSVWIPLNAQQKRALQREVARINSFAERIREIGLFAKERDAQRNVEQILQQGTPDDPRKVIIFVGYIPTGQTLTKRLQEAGIRAAFYHGGLPRAERTRLVSHLWGTTTEPGQPRHPDDLDVLVATDAGGVGLNLHAANHVINYDLSWNPMVVEQRVGRVHRLGQRKTVFVENWIATAPKQRRSQLMTVDQNMRETLAVKISLIRDLGIDLSDEVIAEQLLADHELIEAELRYRTERITEQEYQSIVESVVRRKAEQLRQLNDLKSLATVIDPAERERAIQQAMVFDQYNHHYFALLLNRFAAPTPQPHDDGSVTVALRNHTTMAAEFSTKRLTIDRQLAERKPESVELFSVRHPWFQAVAETIRNATTPVGEAKQIARHELQPIRIADGRQIPLDAVTQILAAHPEAYQLNFRIAHTLHRAGDPPRRVEHLFTTLLLPDGTSSNDDVANGLLNLLPATHLPTTTPTLPDTVRERGSRLAAKRLTELVAAINTQNNADARIRHAFQNSALVRGEEKLQGEIKELKDRILPALKQGKTVAGYATPDDAQAELEQLRQQLRQRMEAGETIDQQQQQAFEQAMQVQVEQAAPELLSWCCYRFV